MNPTTNLITLLKATHGYNQKTMDSLLSEHHGMELFLQLFTYLDKLHKADTRGDNAWWFKHMEQKYGYKYD